MIFYPDDPPGTWPVVLIPVCETSESHELELYTTAKCFTSAVDSGDIPLFAYKGILELLHAYRVEAMIGTVDCWNFPLDEQEGLPLCMIALKVNSSIGKTFSFFVDRYGGTLRIEKKYDWCFFEST